MMLNIITFHCHRRSNLIQCSLIHFTLASKPRAHSKFICIRVLFPFFFLLLTVVNVIVCKYYYIICAVPRLFTNKSKIEISILDKKKNVHTTLSLLNGWTRKTEKYYTLLMSFKNQVKSSKRYGKR